MPRDLTAPRRKYLDRLWSRVLVIHDRKVTRERALEDAEFEASLAADDEVAAPAGRHPPHQLGAVAAT